MRTRYERVFFLSMIRIISRITPPIRKASSKDIPDLHMDSCNADYAMKLVAALSIFPCHPLIYCGFLALFPRLALPELVFLSGRVVRQFLQVRSWCVGSEARWTGISAVFLHPCSANFPAISKESYRSLRCGAYGVLFGTSKTSSKGLTRNPVMMTGLC